MFSKSKEPYKTIARQTRRDITRAGLETQVRAEIAAALEELTFELEPIVGREEAAVIARTFVPGSGLATAFLLRVRKREVGALMRECEALDTSLRDAIERPLSDSAAPESQIVARVIRNRIQAVLDRSEEL